MKDLQLNQVTVFDLKKNDSLSVATLKKELNCSVHDTMHSQLRELVRLENPRLKGTDEEAIDQLIKEKLNDCSHSDYYGVWVYYPWHNTLVHLLDEKQFIQVRTIRNRNKITEAEQNTLSHKKIGVVGLSVGQSVSVTMAIERIFGELRIADFDSLELGNLNRLRASCQQIGMPKTKIVQREISEIDPFLNVRCFDEGVTYENIDAFLGSKDDQLDVIIDECDSIEIKALLRKKASEKGIPVIMDTSDRGMLDVERYDLDNNYPPFHGLITRQEFNDLIERRMNQQEMFNIALKILDTSNMSERLKSSIDAIGKTITSWPQLASAVAYGGGIATLAARKILLNLNVSSQRYYIDAEKVLNE